MTVVFLLPGKSLNHYDFDQIRHPNVRLVGIVNEGHKASVSEKSASCLDALFIVPDEKKIGPLYYASFQHVMSLASAYVSECSPEKVYVVCPDEGDILLSAMLREHFSSPGMKSDEAIIFRDKARMKDQLNKSCILVPKYIEIELSDMMNNKNYFLEVQKLLGETFIIKPRSAAAGFGVFRINSHQRLKKVFNKIVDSTLAYEAEELLHGDMYHCDIGIFNKKVFFFEVASYNTNNFDAESKNNLIGSFCLDSGCLIRGKIFDFCYKALSAITQSNGFFHCEFFVKEGSITLLEIGARLPGGLITQMYSQMYKTNFFNLDFMLQSNSDKIDKLNRFDYGFWILIILYNNSKILKLRDFQDLNFHWSVRENEIVFVNDDGYRFIGSCIFNNPDQKLVENNFKEIITKGIDGLIQMKSV